MWNFHLFHCVAHINHYFQLNSPRLGNPAPPFKLPELAVFCRKLPSWWSDLVAGCGQRVTKAIKTCLNGLTRPVPLFAPRATKTAPNNSRKKERTFFCVPHAPKCEKSRVRRRFALCFRPWLETIFILRTDYWGHNRIHAVNYFCRGRVAWAEKTMDRLLSPLCGINFHINATTSAAEIKFAKSGFVSGWRKLFIFVLLEATMKVGWHIPRAPKLFSALLFALISRLSEETGNPLLREWETFQWHKL
jgi:hypothetical protein